MSLVKASSDFISQVWNKKPSKICSSIYEIFSDNVIISTPLLYNTGAESLRQSIAFWFQAFPDVKFKVYKVFDYGLSVVCYWKAKGTHLESFKGIAACNKKLECCGETVLIFNEESRVVHYTVKLDMARLLATLKDTEPSSPSILPKPNIRDNLTTLFKALAKFYPSLSFRELECVSFFISGFSSKQIGSRLDISARTVEVHLEKARFHLSCNNRTQMIERFLIDSTYFLFQNTLRLLLIEPRGNLINLESTG